MTHAVFISYASADRTAADAVCAALEEAGIACWIAPRDVVAGTPYAADIVEAIRGARVLLLVFSAAADASTQVRREVDRAAALGLPILPLRIEEVQPSQSLEYYLAGQHWMDALTPPLEEHRNQLLAAVRALVAGSVESAPSPAPAGERACREERRVVTCVSFGLADFATMSAHLDPEIVDSLLRRYARLVRGGVESYGGSIVTIAGDSVSAVFGLPAIHEDDAERAIRAALEVCRASDDLPQPGDKPLAIRAAVETGEALVRLGIPADSDESILSGGPLSIAVGLRTLSRGDGVVIGEVAYALTRDGFEHEALVTDGADGGRGAAWLVKAARPDMYRERGGFHPAPLVGRETELFYLKALFEKAVGSSLPQVALIIGEPGIGKTRLVAELFADVQSSDMGSPGVRGAACLTARA